MKEYKIVKDKEYTVIYDVYQKVFYFWKYLGSFGSEAFSNEKLIKEAKKITSPYTIYFSE